MKIVIDSSTLISLGKIDSINLLKKVEAEIICPEEVHEETVWEGIQRGYPDAITIKRLFDDQTIKTKKTKALKEKRGLTETDSKILALAIKEKAEYVFVDDIKLSRRVEYEKIKARTTPDLLTRMLDKGIIDKKTYKNLLKQLYAGSRLSKENMKQYLREVG